MLDMINEGLKFKAARERGETVPIFATKVLQREQQAIYLLQLRQNFLPMVVLGLATDFDEGIWAMGKHIFFNWTLDLRQANVAQLEEWSKYLWQAQTTRKSLTELGHAILTNPWIKRAYKNISEIQVPKQATDFNQQGSDLFINLMNLHSGKLIKVVIY